MDSVGKSVIRKDAWDKVRGFAKFVRDLEFDELWFGLAVRAKVAHGKIKTVRATKEFEQTGAVLLLPDEIPGKNYISIVKNDMPCIAEESVEYFGEAVALVAAPNLDSARKAAALVEVEIEPLDVIATIEESAGVLSEIRMQKGNVDVALEEAEVVVHGEFHTPAQEHAYIEPQGVVAIPEDGGVHIVGSMQCPYYVRPAVAKVLGLPDDKVRVEQAMNGGAFGGKEDFPSLISAWAALLAMKTNHPVAVWFDREEDISYSTKRHPSKSRISIGLKKDGELVAIKTEYMLDGGAYTTLSPVVLARGVIHATGPYRCPNVDVHGKVFRTNKPPAGAFRGFGAPQATFPIESILDKAARELGISPLEIRKKNVIRPGDSTGTGQILEESVAAEQCLKEVEMASGFNELHAEIKEWNKHEGKANGKRRGLGISLFWHGGGFTGRGEIDMLSEAEVALKPDGVVEIRVANTEMGQGALTALSQIVAHTCGIPLEMVTYPLPDTSRVPNSGPTVASRTTMVVGKILERCAAALVEEVAKRTNTRKEEENFKGADGRVYSWEEAAKIACNGEEIVVRKQYEPPKGYKGWDESTYQGDAYASYSWGAAVAEVEVDVGTYEVTPLRVWAVVDIGRAINPREASGQVEGGLLQALGYGLFENLTVSEDGRYEQNRLQTYIIPSSADVPNLWVKILEHPSSAGPYGAKGLGELPMNGLAAALRSAVEDAMEIELDRIPVTPELVMEACENAK